MTTKKKYKLFSNPWVIAVGSVLVIRLIDFLTGSNIWEWLKNILVGIHVFFSQKFEWTPYGLILLFISGPAIGILIIWIILKFQNTQDDSLPDWLKYKRDTFDGIVYKWEYVENYEGRYDIKNIIPYCPNCECQLIDEDCPNCKNSYHRETKSDYELKTLIRYRVEKPK
jgi:hypothetical protein